MRAGLAAGRTAPAAPAAGSRPPAVTVTGLRKSYGGVAAVRGASFSVAAGEIFALLGPNGAGKTSILEILEGFRGRDSGQVAVLGLDPADRSQGRVLRERIGLVLQDIAVEPYLTVRETVARNAGYYPAPRTAGEVISLVGLAGLERRKVRSLSSADLPPGAVSGGAVPAGAGPSRAASGAGPSGDLLTLETAEPEKALHQLTGWALGRGVPLDRLTVDRPSLEDIYLRLTGPAAAGAGPEGSSQ